MKRTKSKVVLVGVLVALLMSAQAVSGKPVSGQPVKAQQLSITDLGILDGSSSLARDINNRGQVVGFSAIASGAPHAVLWSK